MNNLDYIIIGFVVVGGVWGAIKGFIDEISDKFGYVLGLVVSLMFTVLLSPVFQSKLELPVWLASFLSYIILFLAGFIVMKLLGRVLEGITETAHLGWVNNTCGLVLGLLEAVVIVGLVESVLLNQSFINITKFTDGSIVSQKVILPVFKAVSTWIQSLV